MKNLIKRSNIFLGITLLLGLLSYIYINFFCGNGSLCFSRAYEQRFVESMYYFFLGYFATALLLHFFPEKIFNSWTKHIAWWFPVPVIYFVMGMNPYSSGILSITRAQATLFWMAILFIVTLVYALIMRKRVG